MPRALTRCVGISCCAFCTACGQSRMLLRSSSGEKSRFVSHVPASSATMSMPAWAMGSAATPPAAPRPMTTTSVSLRRVAMIVTAVVIPRRGLREHRVVVGRLVIRLERDADPLIGFGHDSPDAGIAEQIPADEVRVAAVERIAECALDGVRADERKEGRWQALGLAGLDVAQYGVLIRGGQLRKRRTVRLDGVPIDRREPRGVRLAAGRKK